MRGSVFVMLPLNFLTLIFARELCIGCDMFFSPALTQNHAMVAEYMKRQSSEVSGS